MDQNKNIMTGLLPEPAPPMPSIAAPRATVPVNDQTSLRNAVTAAPDGVPTTIELINDITLTASTLLIPVNKIITLTGNFTLTQSAAAATITVAAFADLTIDGITITHAAGITGSGVSVNTNTVLTMNSGLIAGNTATSYGGGVYFSTGGSFTMNGGAITNNQANWLGGGVYVTGGTFIMWNGEISNNQATGIGVTSRTGLGGGVAVLGNSTFTMHGGLISGNTSDGTNFIYGGGSSHYMGGGGIYLYGQTPNVPTFTMWGGVISGNTALNGSGGGIYGYHGIGADRPQIVIQNGEIINNTATITSVVGMLYSGHGGGIASTGPITMYDGKINYNQAITTATTIDYNTYSKAGGVYADRGFTMYGGEICFNEAEWYAGVEIGYGDFTMYDGRICNNIAIGDELWGGGYGGGVTMNAPNGIFTMEGGEISGNVTKGNPGDDYDLYGGAGVMLFYGELLMSGGAITGNIAEGAGSGGGVYSYRGSITMTGGVISNNSAAQDGGGIYHTSGLYLSLSGNAAITGNTAGQSGGGVWVPHDHLVILTVGPDVIFANNRAAISTTRNPADDAIYLTNILGTNWTVPFTQGFNNYDIGFIDPQITLDVHVELRANKSAVGAVLSDQQFEFGLFDQAGDLLETAGNNADGTIIFPTIRFIAAGVHNYTIRELTPSGNGWVTDSRVYRVTVTVTSTGISLEAVATYPDGFPNFVNTYSAAAAIVTLTGSKSAVGAALPDGRFNFGVFDTGSNLVAIASNNAAGGITFSNITLTAPGVYHYTIHELAPAGGGWTPDPRSYPVTVTVTDNQAGQLVAQISYPNGAPVFVDTYSAAPAEVALTATKTAFGAALPESGFEFGLFDQSGSLIASAANSAAGFISFSTVTLNAPGVYHYTIRELTPSGSGWIADGRVYQVTVTVTDNGAGQLIANIEYPGGITAGFPNFVDRYSASTAYATLTATKSAVGATLPAGRFDFGLLNQNGNLIAVAANDAAGNVSFTNVPFTAPGVYHYSIREISPSMGGWTTDSTVYPVTITVTDNGAGQLSATVVYPNGVPSFTNSFSLIPTSDILVAFKQLQGWNHPEIPFTFGRFDSTGGLVDTAQNVGGVVEFTPLTYTAPGVYHFTVRELTPSGNGWTTDSTVYPVTVTVTEENGELIRTITYPNGQPTFIDTYTAAPTEVTVAANKTAVGAPLVAGDFTFTLADQNGSPVAKGTNDTAGNVTFPSIPFTEPGVYDYTMSETDYPAGWTPDTRTFPVLITVTDNQAGQLVESVSYPAGVPHFTNTFNPGSTTANVVAFKKLLNWDRPEIPFTFGLFDASGNTLISSAQNVGGVIEFPPLTYTETGVFHYTVRELSPLGGGWTPDDKSYPVTVTVTAEGGELAATVSYPEGQPTFIDTYAPTPVEANIAARKITVGEPLVAGDFVFGVFDSAGIPVAKKVNDANGDVFFTDIILTTPGVYDYTVRETAGPPGWTLDTTVYPVVVTVTDNGAGKLVANVSYPAGFPSFTNSLGLAPAELVLTASKTVIGAPLKADLFTFTVFDSEGEPLVSAKNDAEGNVVFPTILISEPGSFNYSVRETVAPVGWIADTHTFPFSVTAVDNGMGQLILISPVEQVPFFHFTNTFAGSGPGTATVAACVRLCGAPLCQGDFTFGLFDQNGREVTRAANDRCGKIVFPALTFSQPGVFHYTIRGLNPSSPCWVMDTKVWPVTVTVTDNGAGQLAATVSYPEGKPIFVQRFCPPGGGRCNALLKTVSVYNLFQLFQRCSQFLP